MPGNIQNAVKQNLQEFKKADIDPIKDEVMKDVEMGITGVFSNRPFDPQEEKKREEERQKQQAEDRKKISILQDWVRRYQESYARFQQQKQAQSQEQSQEEHQEKQIEEQKQMQKEQKRENIAIKQAQTRVEREKNKGA